MVNRMFARIALISLSLLAIAPGASAALHYTVELSDDARRLSVSMCTDRPIAPGTLRTGSQSARLVSLRGDGDSRPSQRGDRIVHDRLGAGQCVQYGVDARAAAESDRYGVSWRANQYLMLKLTDWLWRPSEMPDGSRATLQLPAGWSASVPWTPLDRSGRRYSLPNTPRGWNGFTAFGRFEERRMALPGGQLRVSVLPTANARQTEQLHAWMALNVRAVMTSSGRLPLPDAQVLVVPLPGNRSPTPWGQVSRGGGSALRLFAGLDAPESVRNEDWTLSHELAHLFHPYLGDSGRWMSEGLASYYQNVLRARSGILSAERAWSKLDAGFGRGLNERSTRGQRLVDVASGYRGTMRVYWSGAAYWLEADAALREHHGTTLDAVLAEFARRHLPAYSRWQAAQFADELDRLAGTRLFAPLYERYARSTRFPDLTDTYQRLGLGSGVERLRLRDRAPALAVREAIMAAAAPVSLASTRRSEEG